MKKIIYISIITIFIFSIFGCSGKNKIESLLEEANLCIENDEFKRAKVLIDSAKVLGEFGDFKWDIVLAYKRLDIYRSSGSIEDSLLKKIIEKHDVNIEYDEEGNIEHYGSEYDLHFRISDDGKLSCLDWTIRCPISDKTPKYIEDIEISTNNYFYVRNYNFFEHKKRGVWVAHESIYKNDDSDKIQMFKDIVFSSPVEIKFCGIENNFDYISLQVSLNKDTWNAYWEIVDNLW